MTEQSTLVEAQATIDRYNAACTEFASFEWPALTVETVTDDGETFDALRCPWCSGVIIDEDELVAVDTSERWSRADDLSDTSIAEGEITFIDGSDDYGETEYYLHLASNCIRPLSLPEGFTESWR